ncbi:MAG: tRNA-dihydrouridine synthase family protein [Desulfobacterales bacterium]|nr:tRNA-dihydrouridine synthase family protein [Desulfobacterales bacterium]
MAEERNLIQHRHKLYLAPLKGFTDHVFRNVFSEHFGGFDVAVAPFISSKSDTKIKRNYVKDVLPENNTGMPVIPQILSKTAEDFVFLANYLYDIGYKAVNWNLGCPFPMVAKKRRGSGMLPHTDMILEFLDTAVPALKGTMSIKIRLGWKSPDELFRLIPSLNQYDIDELMIHPRTGLQRYSGTTDLDSFEHCLEMTELPIVYNGDIRNYEDFIRLSERFNHINRWMIGRWCIANPFLPATIKSGQNHHQEKIEMLKQFHTELFQQYRIMLDGPSHLLNKMKGIWRYFSLPFDEFKKTMKRIKKSTSPDQYLDLVNQFFDNEAKWEQ